MSRQDPVLEVSHLAKSYGRNQVLKDITFGIGQGEIIGITGENGSGKSTLLNVIVGRSRADAGTVSCNVRFGFCPQELLIFEQLTVEENLRYFATAYGLGTSVKIRPDSVNDLLDRFGCRRHLRSPVYQLSGGTKQKLNLILAFLHSPDLLVLDEPYSGFDWETYLGFWEYARMLRSQARSILVVAHLIFDKSQLDVVYTLAGGVLQCA